MSTGINQYISVSSGHIYFRPEQKMSILIAQCTLVSNIFLESQKFNKFNEFQGDLISLQRILFPLEIKRLYCESQTTFNTYLCLLTYNVTFHNPNGNAFYKCNHIYLFMYTQSQMENIYLNDSVE